MGDYVIWMAEKYMEEAGIEWSVNAWERVMSIVTTRDLGPAYSIETYLKEVR